MYKRLKDLREDHEFTQEQIGEMLNMSQRGYSHIETGNNDISSEDLIKLSKIYNVSTDYILGISDIPSQYLKKEDKKNNN
ncbi:MAG: helix-turn-helix transcriptional regulator [Bacilli bacterium]|nr:helix-turn-helix transcriptional regulator [Bacilli bacterium]